MVSVSVCCCQKVWKISKNCSHGEMDEKFIQMAMKQSSSGLGTDWQLGCRELKQRGGHLLQTGQWADCSFVVGMEPHQVTITAHKVILASASPVFEAMFFGRMAEGDGPIKILDVQPDAFKILLLYMYTDETNIRSFEKACSVYYAAKKYMLPYLEKECTWFISLNLDPQNVCRAYELALLFDENLLVEKCLKIMETKTKEVLIQDSFIEASLSTVNTLLCLENLNVSNELDLFNAVEKYAKVHLRAGQYKRRSEIEIPCECSMKRSKIDGDDDPLNCTMNGRKVVSLNTNSDANLSRLDDTLVPHEETGELTPKQTADTSISSKMVPDLVHTNTPLDEDEDTSTTLTLSESSSVCMSQESQDGLDNIERESLRGVMGKIRFLTLTATQFAAGPARSALLSESEAFAVLMNILSSAADVPMPRGFSTCRVPRNQQNIIPEVAEGKSEAIFRFTVLNFKSRRRSVESRPFLFLDAPWTLKLVPRFESDTSSYDKKYFGLYLKCGSNREKQFSHKVKADIRLVSHQPNSSPVTGQINRVFTNKEHEWGFERFVSWDSVLSPERGLLRNNAVVIEVHVVSDS